MGAGGEPTRAGANSVLLRGALALAGARLRGEIARDDDIQLRRDSNPQPPDSKSDTLSIAPRSLRKEGRGRGTLLARAEAAEVLGRLGHDVGAQRHLDAPRRLAADGHVEEDLWYCDGFFRWRWFLLFGGRFGGRRSRRIFCQRVCLGALGTVGGARGPLVAAHLAAAARVRVRASRAQGSLPACFLLSEGRAEQFFAARSATASLWSFLGRCCLQ